MEEATSVGSAVLSGTSSSCFSHAFLGSLCPQINIFLKPGLPGVVSPPYQILGPKFKILRVFWHRGAQYKQLSDLRHSHTILRNQRTFREYLHHRCNRILVAFPGWKCQGCLCRGGYCSGLLCFSSCHKCTRSTPGRTAAKALWSFWVGLFFFCNTSPIASV